MTKHIDPELVRAYFDYDPETGILKNKVQRGPRGRRGEEAGTIDYSGPDCDKPYFRVRMEGSIYYAHRIIWVWMTGDQPETVDHIDGNGLNNRWENLRNVSHSENMRNRKLNKNSTSGMAGVHQTKRSGKWQARISVDGKRISLGAFESKDEAIVARKAAETKYWS